MKIDSTDREDFLRTKLIIYAQMKELDSVNYLGKLLIKLDPDNFQYYKILITSERVNGNYTEMLKTMDTTLKRSPQNSVVAKWAISIYAKYSPERLKFFYNNLLKSNTYSDKEKTLLFYPLLDLMKKDKLSKQILERQLPKLAFGPPINISAIYLYSATQTKKGNLDSASAIIKEGIKLNNKSPLLWYGLLSFYSLVRETDSIQFYSQKVLKYIPHSPVPYYFQSIADMSNSERTEGIKNLKLAYQYNKKDSLITNFTILSSLGSIYQTINQQDSAEVYYIKALEINPKSYIVLNNYSHLLAEENRDLDTALEMSQKTLAKYPYNPTFLDTYGWILYKQKHYIKSKTFIENAVKNFKKPNPVLFEQLGDVESALGDAKRAQKDWKKSLRLGNNSAELQEKLKN